MARTILAIAALIGVYILAAGFDSGQGFRSSPGGGSGYTRMGRDAGQAVSVGAVSAIRGIGQ